jgi:hypothetical protein
MAGKERLLDSSRDSHRTLDLHKQRIPRRLLLLDAVGAALAAAGVLTLLEVEVPGLPEFGRAPGTGIMLLGLGMMLMLAVPAWLLRQHRHRGPRPRGGKIREP